MSCKSERGVLDWDLITSQSWGWPSKGRGSNTAGLNMLQCLRCRFGGEGKGFHRKLVYLQRNVESVQNLKDWTKYGVCKQTSSPRVNSSEDSSNFAGAATTVGSWVGTSNGTKLHAVTGNRPTFITLFLHKHPQGLVSYLFNFLWGMEEFYHRLPHQCADQVISEG